MTPEIECVEPVDDKVETPSEIIESMNVDPNLSVNVDSDLSLDEQKTSSEETPTQISYPPGYLAREQREARLRQKAIELDEDPDKFMIITEKDKLDSISFKDKMQTDARMCGFAKEGEEDPKEYMVMKIRERLIGEEIIRRYDEKHGISSSWLNTDEE
ncbi:1170_t:CDS:1 [Diversispora eburnea]|uniref:1170_t:CDS:1 n=1 Tax=Diversispora eburnea TaxID=1213867 RepID=A0A9N9BXA9_9GLOM|nr:1170_t:CDS:1 [Diversispora eburnea]